MLKIAIVGYGFMGRTHYGVWRKLPGTKVVAICDANLAQLTAKVIGNRANADHSPIPDDVRVYADFDAMLAAGGLDIVDITLPTPLHPEMSIKALDAGCHVLCEKPMAVDAASCDRMLAAEKRAKGRFLIAQCTRFNPKYAYLKQLVESERYGKVVAADFSRFCPLPGWGGRQSWFVDERKSGGVAVDMHIHDADFITYLFGLPPAVSSRAHVRRDGITDHLATTYLYDGKVVTSDVSWAAAKSLVFESSLRVFFERATVCGGEHLASPFTVYPETGKPFSPKLSTRSEYELEIRYFLGLARGRMPRPVILTARDARNAIALVMAEKRSAKLGHVVKVKV